ncbi:MAG: CvpA family protein [Planctomycetia bacterium]|nr:CvpA family protein [Planctomycetia bacterium]MBL6913992.1 CvpA family protein [Planctomycetota bacterium]HCW45427.1 hypothetical protein [Planctomycetota bacterium]
MLDLDSNIPAIFSSLPLPQCLFILPEWLDGSRAADNLSRFWIQSNWIDVVIILGMLAGLFTGAGLGFYRSTALLFGSTLGALLSMEFSIPLSMSETFATVRLELGPLGAQILSGLTIFICCIALTMLVTFFFRSFFDRTLLACDSILGALMGGGMAALLFGLLMLGIFQWPDGRIHTPIKSSIIGVPLAEATGKLDRFFPGEFRDRFQISLEDCLVDEINIVPASSRIKTSQPR